MPFSLPGLAEVYGLDPAWSSSQLLTGSSERLSRNTPEKKPPKKATGCWVSSLKIGVSSLRNIFVSPCAADACMTDSSGILACPAGLAKLGRCDRTLVCPASSNLHNTGEIKIPKGYPLGIWSCLLRLRSRSYIR